MRWPWQNKGSGDRLVVGETADGWAFALADSGGRLRRCGTVAGKAVDGGNGNGHGNGNANGNGAAEVARQLRALGLPSKGVCAVLPLADAQLLSVEAPAVRPEEMKAAARWRIKELVDVRLDELTIDVMFVGDDQPRPKRQVYVAAARTALIRGLGERLSASGLELAVIDIAETAQRNLQSAVATAEGLGARATAALVRHGEQCLLTVCAGGELYYTRRLDWADLPQAKPAAAVFKTPDEQETGSMDFVDYGAEPVGAAATAAGDAPRMVVELQRSFDLWERSWPALPLAALWVQVGEGSDGFAKLLDAALGQPVKVLDAERIFPGLNAAAGSVAASAAVLPLLGALLREETRRA